MIMGAPVAVLPTDGAYQEAVMSEVTERRSEHQPLIETWPWARALFAERTAASGILWLIVRVLLGWQWLEAGINKLQNFDPWRSGAAVQGFARGALANME